MVVGVFVSLCVCVCVCYSVATIRCRMCHIQIYVLMSFRRQLRLRLIDKLCCLKLFEKML